MFNVFTNLWAALTGFTAEVNAMSATVKEANGRLRASLALPSPEPLAIEDKAAEAHAPAEALTAARPVRNGRVKAAA
jgi:hypothetical protein